MNITAFSTSNPPDARVLFENFGVTFYHAQLLEDNLKLILVAAEQLGVAKFDRKKHLKIKHTDEDLLAACMGSLKGVLRANRKPTDDDTLYDALDVANHARRLLAHRFFLEHSVDLLSEGGRCAINQHLSKLYFNIVQANTIAKALRDRLFTEIGFTPEMAAKKLEELKETISESENEN